MNPDPGRPECALVSPVQRRTFTKGLRVQGRPSQPLPLCSTASPEDLTENAFIWLDADLQPMLSVAEVTGKCNSACALPAGALRGPACPLSNTCPRRRDRGPVGARLGAADSGPSVAAGLRSREWIWASLQTQGLAELNLQSFIGTAL